MWQEVDQLTIAGGNTSWGTPVAMDGTTIMLGDIDDTQQSGAVHVFEWIGGSWIATQVIRASPSIPDSHFGRRIVIDGDRAAISAPMDPSVELRGGSVFLFERINGVWSADGQLNASPPHYFGFYGLGLALEGDVVAVGEPYLDHGPNLVYLYVRGPTGWTLLTTLTGGGSKFGRALSLENGVLAAGDYQDVTPGGGSVRLFDAGAGWQQTGIVTALDAGAGFGFGDAVLLHQGQLIVGSASTELGLGEGAYVFQQIGTGWGLSATLLPHGPTGGLVGSHFGSALAADGGDLFVGSGGDDETVSDAGAVYAYEQTSCGTS